MPLSTDVNLPRSHQPTFPDRCVRCDADHHLRDVRLLTFSVGWWTALLSFGRPFSVKVPACRSCSRWIRFQRSGDFLVTVIVAVVVIFGVWPHLEDMVAPAFRKYAAVGLALLCLLPWILWATFFPPSIDVTAFRDSVDYEFRNGKYAADFAVENADAEWVKIT